MIHLSCAYNRLISQIGQTSPWSVPDSDSPLFNNVIQKFSSGCKEEHHVQNSCE